MATSKLVLDIVARDQASATLRRLGVASDGSVNKMEMLNKASRAAAVGLGLWTAAALVSVRAAAEESGEQARLAQTLQQATGATADQAGATDDLLTKMGLATGIADDKLRPALSKLAIATGDLSASQDLLGVALDASVALGKDVETVAVALGKAYNGNVGALGRLGVATKDANGETLTFDQALAQLTERTKGAAAAAGDAKPWQRLQVSIGEAQESIGAGLLPVVSKVSDALADLGPGAIQAGFAVTGVGLAAAAAVPKVLEAKKAIEGMANAQQALALSGKAAAAAATAVGVVVAANAVGIDQINNYLSEQVDITDALATKTGQHGAVLGELIRQEKFFADALRIGTLGLLDMDSAVEASDRKLASFDARWQEMVNSGDMAAAAAEFEQVRAAMEAQGRSTENLIHLFPGYTGALEASRATTVEHMKATSSDAAALDRLATKVDKVSDAWRRYIGLPLDAAEAQMDYNAAARNTVAVLNDESKSREDKRRAVIDEIRAAEDLREAQIESGDSAASATRKYQAHVRELRNAAREAGILKGKTDNLAAALRDIPRTVRSTVIVDTVVPSGVSSHAAGWDGRAAGGWIDTSRGSGFWVGEHGPERVRFSMSGAQVIPHSRSLGGAGGGGDVYNIAVSGDTDPDGAARRIHDRLLTLKRHRGGAPLGLG